MSRSLHHCVQAHAARRAGQRGTSLLEALIAFAVLAGSTIAASRLQADFQLDADVARQRSEAVRFGAAAMETMRAFAVMADVPGARSFAAIASGEAAVDAGPDGTSNASYRVVRSVDAEAVPGAKAAGVEVHWADRSGRDRSVALASFIAGADPVYAGALSVGSGAVPTSTRGAYGRSPAVPLDARDLGNGTSAWRPQLGAAAGFVFDNASGAVVARCSSVAARGDGDAVTPAGPPDGCTAGRWLLVGGTIRFSSAVPASAEQAGNAPLGLTVRLDRAAGDNAPAPLCTAEPRRTQRSVRNGSLHIDSVALDLAAIPAASPADDRFIAWSCLVEPRTDGGWSGRVVLAPTDWRIGAGGGDRRICRYAAATTTTTTADAAADATGPYVNIHRALVAQNFLVVPGDQACPPGTSS